ncbi:MAG: NAD+ synthase [Candidatus Omnitrophica bacterium]|nr:NAD+ synthase [Candidatus Omnitrophota bacterium]
MKKNKTSNQLSTLHIGFAQINPTVGDFDANTEKIISYIHEAENRGVQLLIFPEQVVTGYPVWDLANKSAFVERNRKSLAQIVKKTRRMNVTVVIGYIEKSISKSRHGRNHNALAVIQRGKILAKQFKSLLPTYDVFLEEIFFEPAKEHVVIPIYGLKTGLSICEDLWEDDYEVKPLAQLKKKGAKIMINIASSPFHRNKGELRARLVSRKAKQYGVFMLYCNQVGAQDDLIFDGRCLVADPKGRILFESDAFREGLFEFDLDLLNPMHELKIAPVQNVTPEIYNALVLGIRDYVRKNKFQKVLIGLSGGIDSALTAVLAVDAIGASNVCGVTMPGPFSSSGSVADSRKLAKNLGIELREHSIAGIYDFKMTDIIANKKHDNLATPEENKITLAMENLQARLRAIELMYISNDEDRLLLTTGNKSEMAMGYCTLYGDMSGGLCVLGDVYKTEVYRLAEHRNRISKVIPLETIEKKPSAELRPNQTDQESLPPYSLLDAMLYLYIECNKTPAEIEKELKGKTDIKLIHDVIRKVDHNEYKRRQAAPILRVTEKAWFGRRMPVTNRFDLEG